MKHLESRLLLFAVFTVLAGCTMFGTVRAEEPVKTPPMPVHSRPVVAHRGASFAAPENTLTAYRQAISDGADGAECDVYATQDGVLILFHDKTTKRTLTGEDRVLTELNFNEIRQRDAGIWKGEQFRGERVPTLAEYLDILRETSCHPVIEIKQEGIEAAVLDAVRQHGMLDRTTIIAFSERVVRTVRQLEPRISVAWLYSEKLKEAVPELAVDRLTTFFIAKARELDTTILDLNYTILSEPLVKNLRESGLHVWCWTVNDADVARRLHTCGVESVTTDKPQLYRKSTH